MRYNPMEVVTVVSQFNACVLFELEKPESQLSCTFCRRSSSCTSTTTALFESKNPSSVRVALGNLTRRANNTAQGLPSSGNVKYFVHYLATLSLLCYLHFFTCKDILPCGTLTNSMTDPIADHLVKTKAMTRQQ